MIYIVEIPHQRNPICWTACDEQDAVERMMVSFARYDDVPESDNFNEWMKYNASDLSRQIVYMSSEEALAGLDSEDFNCHGGGKAYGALMARLIERGLID